MSTKAPHELFTLEECPKEMNTEKSIAKSRDEQFLRRRAFVFSQKILDVTNDGIKCI